MNEVLDFLKKVGTYYLATVEGNQPRVRPFGTIHLFEDKLCIQTGKSKEFSKQILKNPNVEICAFDGETWLRVAAKLVEFNSNEAQISMLDAYPSLKSMYEVGDGNTLILALQDATATFSSFTAPPSCVKF
jgi:uncharacterized pyridoxamine 5'-phosphate oxidase family protein